MKNLLYLKVINQMLPTLHLSIFYITHLNLFIYLITKELAPFFTMILLIKIQNVFFKYYIYKSITNITLILYNKITFISTGKFIKSNLFSKFWFKSSNNKFNVYLFGKFFIIKVCRLSSNILVIFIIF